VNFRDRLEEIAQQALGSEDLKNTLATKVGEICDSIQESIEYRLQTDTAYNLGIFVQRIAGNAIKAILSGDEDELRKALHCKEGGWNGRETSNPVIHSKLFESSAVGLRRRIVDAFPDLLKNERILDLEAQVAQLVKQVAAAERRSDDIRPYRESVA
jgi:hypothetical protein